jgi:hypothetical protein
MSKGYSHCVWRWAHQNKGRRNKGKYLSLKYKDDTMYSYGEHWPLAQFKHIEGCDSRIYLVHAVPHSRTTDSHVAEIRDNIPNERTFVVDNDLWHTVVDYATLYGAVELSRTREVDRVARVKREKAERAKANVHERAQQYREQLAEAFGIDVNISDSFANKLAPALGFTPKYTYTWRSVETKLYYNNLLSFFKESLKHTPSLLDKPSDAFTTINAFVQLR